MKAPSTVRNLHALHSYRIETEEPLRHCLKVATLYISKIGFASGRHSLTPGRWLSSRSVLGVPSVPVSSRRSGASGPIPPPPEVSQFFGLGPELCVLERQTSGVLSIASRDPGRAVHSSSLAN